uniref:GcvT protein n=1 Tax=Fopius arisanus TaxID=64838 RepID=A0A0C9PJW1_9HYME
MAWNCMENYIVSSSSVSLLTPQREHPSSAASHQVRSLLVRGVLSEEKPWHKRIYAEIDCAKRPRESFERQSQPQHHLENAISPLTRIKNFDPVGSTILEIMHLFYLGGMKWLLEKWILRKANPARLKLIEVKKLTKIMAMLKSDIPSDFQRNEFDVNQVSRWKATQYRFMLNYCGAVVLRRILSPVFYEHFLLLVVASRILNRKDVVRTHSDYAENLLIKFFTLLELYGPHCKVLSWHNFIHVADDAKKI